MRALEGCYTAGAGVAQGPGALGGIGEPVQGGKDFQLRLPDDDCWSGNGFQQSSKRAVAQFMVRIRVHAVD
ncbi:hypothetical protein MKUB_13340 [Mycobacterium kubicae]|uniref:Uncharacterized protein n=1 Tax=Mycobacterium kubicae TaxID=120959 RepID=A0ABQ1BKR5_9MYCO|nr:hypothetical protein MKUB_13340 [Mycobacterium kubicae]